MELNLWAALGRRGVEAAEYWRLSDEGPWRVWGVETVKGERLALKAIDRARLSPLERQECLPRELRLLARLQHPHLTRSVLAVDTRRLSLLLVPLAPWGSLASILHRLPDQRLPPSQAESRLFLAQILDGLGFLHAHAIAHRNLSPEAVLTDAGGNAVLGDFGLAWEGRVGATESEQEQRRWLGQLDYAAPELLLQEAYAPPPVDVWAFGVLCLRVLHNALPLPPLTEAEANSELVRIAAALLGRLRLPASLDKDLGGVLLAALHPDPKRRFAASALARLPFFPAPALAAQVPLFLRNLD